MPLWPRLRLLPLLVLVAMLSFTVRFMDVVTEVKTLEQARSNSVMASNAEAKTEEHGKAGASAHVPSGIPDTEPVPLPSEAWADPTTADMAYSDTQTAILKELGDRRKELDVRESRLNQREALMRVTEQRIEEKTSELQSLRTQIENLLGKQSEEEEARLQSLVKIYSGMKPKEAAAIFDDLDMDILLQVVGRMSERKSAPIMASMDVKKAQGLTILLAEQKKLPELPDQ